MRGKKSAALPIGLLVIVAILLYSKWDWFHQKMDDLHRAASTVAPSDVTSAAGSVAQRITSAAGKVTIPGGPSSQSGAPATPDTTGPGKGAPTGDAAKTLDGLPVKGKAAMTGYSRDEFGQAWTDDNSNSLGHNGCDTRNDILQRDMTKVTFKSGHCVIATGDLADPYTGTVIHFVRGEKTSTAVQIDHVVALGNVWVSGGQQLTAEQRVDIANDPLNLLAADGPANEAKGDSNAAEWLPANKSYRCAYVSRQVAVKAKYHLSVTQPEKDAIDKVLSTCPGQGLPTA